MMIHCACLFPSSVFFIVVVICYLRPNVKICRVFCYLSRKKDLQGVALCGYKMPLFSELLSVKCRLSLSKNVASLISVNLYFINLMFVVKYCTILVNPVGI